MTPIKTNSNKEYTGSEKRVRMRTHCLNFINKRVGVQIVKYLNCGAKDMQQTY
jgi:hypothetical protein